MIFFLGSVPSASGLTVIAIGGYPLSPGFNALTAPTAQASLTVIEVVAEAFDFSAYHKAGHSGPQTFA